MLYSKKSSQSKTLQVKILKRVIELLIFSNIGLIIFLFFTDGVVVELFGIRINSTTISVSFLCVLLLIRFFLLADIKNSLTVVCSVVLVLSVAEVALRLLDLPISRPTLRKIVEPSKVLGYQMTPLLRDMNIRTNSQGMRDEEHSFIKPYGIKRVLGIGDSFTFGYQVQEKDCYLKVLERQLNLKDRKWEVINAGVSGYNMWQYVAYFKHYGYRYQPDIVTLGIFFDDFYDDMPSALINTGSDRSYLLSWLRLANLIKNSADLVKYRFRYLFGVKYLRSIKERKEFISRSKVYPILTGQEEKSVYDKFELRFKELAKMIKDHKAVLLVVLLPDIIQIHNPELQKLNVFLKAICDRYKIEYLDITPFFEKYKDINALYMLPQDAHTSSEGHRIIAEELEKKIKGINNFD